MLFEHWGARPDEIGGPFVGDELVPDATLLATRSISLDAPPADVYPWLAQMGFGKAGWYSYDWLDNLGRRSATEIHPEWQVDEGDEIPGGPITFTAPIARPGEAFVLAVLRPRLGFTLAFDLRPEGAGTRLVTRLRVRLRWPGGRLIERFVLGPGDGVMVRRQLLGLRERTTISAENPLHTNMCSYMIERCSRRPTSGSSPSTLGSCRVPSSPICSANTTG